MYTLLTFDGNTLGIIVDSKKRVRYCRPCCNEKYSEFGWSELPLEESYEISRYFDDQRRNSRRPVKGGRVLLKRKGDFYTNKWVISEVTRDRSLRRLRESGLVRSLN